MSAYPSTFNPNKKVEDPQRYGVPEFEPLLKAGGHWACQLTVPEEIRETGATFSRGHSQDVRSRRSEDASGKGKGRDEPEKDKSVTWIIEIASQILFSNSAVVHFEVLVGRDERSLELGFAAVAGHGHGAPGQVADYQNREKKRDGQHSHPHKGVYSRAVGLVVEDTEALWDKPALPVKEDEEEKGRKSRDTRKSRDVPRPSTDKKEKETKPIKKKKIHLVVLTHGLHSNIGADMLYLKESIDATVKQARLDARKRKAAYKAQQREQNNTQTSSSAGPSTDDKTTDNPDSSTAPISGGQEELQDNDDDGSDDEEQTIVRGFSGNAVRTEKGIQYLGKRLAKYILNLTYPDQPFLPVKKSMTRSFADSFKSQSTKAARDGLPAHTGSSIHKDHDHVKEKEDLAYTFTSISFVGHSLGGLIQTYAVAYIQKHAPHFFTQIQPVNFICLASPLLGLSNENPMYVKFALDFGLVGRTGQDLGLTWRAPTLAKSGWSNLVNGFGSSQAKDKEKEADPGAKPLLRILPTGPAHAVLRMFRNRTVYANVVNDGIVPLRTSCLLFLDWRGLGKVDKARRENGLIGTMAEWGWAELTGANALSKLPRTGTVAIEPDNDTDAEESGTNTPTQHGQGSTVPQPPERATNDDNRDSTRSASSSAEPDSKQFLKNEDHVTNSPSSQQQTGAGNNNNGGIIDTFISFIRPGTTASQSNKVTKAIRRGQTMSPSPAGSISSEQENDGPSSPSAERRSLISRGSTDNPMMLHPHGVAASPNSKNSKKRPAASRGDSVDTEALAPPRTSIFESASDILHPPIPSESWIIDPSSRNRTIFHDRIYHPEDIPPPPTKRPGMGRSFSGMSLGRSFSYDSVRSNQSKDTSGLASASTSTLTAETSTSSGAAGPAQGEVGSMRLEEKIARAYHRDLSWRKVLVRLEPDAHNNMIVRRMFANAYGWPVVKHLCDTHFADTWTARMRDEDEPAFDRAAAGARGEVAEGEEVEAQGASKKPSRSHSEMREANDELGGLKEVGTGIDRHRTLQPHKEAMAHAGSVASAGSGVWDDIYFEGGSDEDDEPEEDSYGSRFQKMVGGWGMGGGAAQSSRQQPSTPTPSKQQPILQQPKKNKLPNLRNTNSGSQAQPVLSSDIATGRFSPSHSPFGSGFTSQLPSQPTTAKNSTTTLQQPPPALVAEPEAMNEDESIDPGNLTPSITGHGFVRGGASDGTSTTTAEMERMVTAPEPVWMEDHRPGTATASANAVEGKGFGEAEVGLRKSVEAQLSPGSEGVEGRGTGEVVARLSSSGGGVGSGNGL